MNGSMTAMWHVHWYDRRGDLIAFYQRRFLSTLVVVGMRHTGNYAVYSRVGARC